MDRPLETMGCEQRWVGISKNIPPWSCLDAAVAGAAAATSAAASGVCINYVHCNYRGALRAPHKYMIKYIQQKQQQK